MYVKNLKILSKTNFQGDVIAMMDIFIIKKKEVVLNVSTIEEIVMKNVLIQPNGMKISNYVWIWNMIC